MRILSFYSFVTALSFLFVQQVMSSESQNIMTDAALEYASSGTLLFSVSCGQIAFHCAIKACSTENPKEIYQNAKYAIKFGKASFESAFLTMKILSNHSKIKDIY